MIGSNWNKTLGCHAVKKILNEIKTLARSLMLFLAVALDAADERAPPHAVGLAAPRQRSCGLSEIGPRGYGWNILYLEWPYFQAVAHHETRLHCALEKKCRLETRPREAGRKPAGECPWNIRARPIIYISNSEILEALPCKLESLSFP